MKLSKFDIFKYELPLSFPLTTSGESKRLGLIIKLEDNEGNKSFGEVAPLSGLHSESLDVALGQLVDIRDKALSNELSLDFNSMEDFFQGFEFLENYASSVCFGSEMAFLNLWSVIQNKNIVSLLNNPQSKVIPVSGLLSGDEAAILDAADRLLSEGTRSFKLKVEGKIKGSISLVQKIQKKIGDRVTLRLDGNQKWSFDEAVSFSEAIDKEKIDYFEEPFLIDKRKGDLSEVYSDFYDKTGIGLALDESLLHEDLENIEMIKGLKALVIKPSLFGLRATLKLISFCQLGGIQAVISSCFESGITLSFLGGIAAYTFQPEVAAGLGTYRYLEKDLLAEPLVLEDGLLDVQAARIQGRNIQENLLKLPEKIIPNTLMSFFLYETAKKFPKNPALKNNKGILNYSDYFSLVVQTATTLQEKGIKKGDKVSFIVHNQFEYIILMMALWSFGAVAIPLSPRIPLPQIELILKNINCSIILLPRLNSAGKVEGLTNLFLEDVLATQGNGDWEKESFKADNDQEATVLFTSGTTQFPKAVLHTLGNHFYSALGANENMPFGPGDTWLLSLPLFHVGGLSILFRAALSGGAIAMTDLKKSTQDTIQRFEITHLSLVPTQLYRFLENPELAKELQDLKAVLVGGSEAPRLLIEKAKANKIPLYLTYGLTEMSSQVATTEKGVSDNFSGKILPYRELKIDLNEEILVRGKTLFKGYFKEGQLEKPFDEEGWFETGDLGSLDEEGRLTVLGRKDNLIISGGENIYPEEIEMHLCEILKTVNTIVVPIENKEFGERPVAFVKTGEPIDEGKVRKQLEEKLPRFKIPDFFLSWPEGTSEEEMKWDRAFFRKKAEEELKINT